MCDFCTRYDFRRVIIANDPDFPHIALAGGRLGTLPEKERFRFCPMCGRKLTEENFRGRELD